MAYTRCGKCGELRFDGKLIFVQIVAIELQRLLRHLSEISKIIDSE